MPSISIPAAVALGGAALGAAGSIFGGIAGQQANDYQAAVARNNAKIAQQNAGYAAAAGAAKTEAEGLKSAQKSGGVRAAIAANGLDVNSGSPADVQTSEREIGTLNTATVANDAALQVYGYESEKTSFQAQSQLYKAEGEDALIGGILGAGGSLVQAAPNLPDKFSWMQGSGDDSGVAWGGGPI